MSNDPDPIGRVDVHSHLLPGLDDGCETMEESLQCARLLVAAGYTHLFCTPHVGPQFPDQTVARIGGHCAEFARRLREAEIPLEVLPGGEINLTPEILQTPPAEVVTLGLGGRCVLLDFWADEIPPLLEPTVRHLRSLGMKVILAHPERLSFVHKDPHVVERFLEMDLLLQGNLQCFAAPPGSPNRRTVERLVADDRYFMLASDTHRLETLPPRLDGLLRAIELAGQDLVDELTIDNPRKLLPRSVFD